MNREAYERVIASVLRAHPAATREGVVEMLWELRGRAAGRGGAGGNGLPMHRILVAMAS